MLWESLLQIMIDPFSQVYLLSVKIRVHLSEIWIYWHGFCLIVNVKGNNLIYFIKEIISVQCRLPDMKTLAKIIQGMKFFSIFKTELFTFDVKPVFSHSFHLSFCFQENCMGCCGKQTYKLLSQPHIIVCTLLGMHWGTGLWWRVTAALFTEYDCNYETDTKVLSRESSVGVATATGSTTVASQFESRLLMQLNPS